jgi:hypothetical protein
MRWRCVSAWILAVPSMMGCASQQDAGAALVDTGLIVAVATAEAATRPTVFTSQGYSASTSRHAGAAAAGVAAGVALAAVGSALESGAPDDAPRAQPHNSVASPPSSGWRLVRPAEDAETSEDPEPSR